MKNVLVRRSEEISMHFPTYSSMALVEVDLYIFAHFFICTSVPLLWPLDDGWCGLEPNVRLNRDALSVQLMQICAKSVCVLCRVYVWERERDRVGKKLISNGSSYGGSGSNTTRMPVLHEFYPLKCVSCAVLGTSVLRLGSTIYSFGNNIHSARKCEFNKASAWPNSKRRETECRRKVRKTKRSKLTTPKKCVNSPN